MALLSTNIGDKTGVGGFVRRDLRAYVKSEALLHNIRQLRSCCAPGTKFCAVVKANAYGHGILPMVEFLRETDVDFFAVANVSEALHIANRVERQEIVVLEPLYAGQDADAIVQCAELGVHCTIASLETAVYVNSILMDTPFQLNVHVNVDTGMARCGIDCLDATSLLECINDCGSMKLTGIYTHFANADEEDISFARTQLKCFQDVLEKADMYITDDVVVHAANSAATIRLCESHFDMVRCGLSMYGYSTVEGRLPVELRPVLKLTAPIVHLITVEKGQSIGYGRTFVAAEDMRIAILPIGYADGFVRLYSNRAKIKINTSVVPIVGTVTMNQIMVDVTSVPDVKVGQLVTIIDDTVPSPCSVYSLADLAGSICYEVLTSIPAWASVEIVPG